MSKVILATHALTAAAKPGTRCSSNATSWTVPQGGLFIDTAMRAQYFPILESEALEEISTFQIYEAFQHIRGKFQLIPFAAIKAAIQEFRQKCQVLTSMIAHDANAINTA